MPSIPRNPFIAVVSPGLPARHLPIADSLSHTKARGTTPHPRSSSQWPHNRSGDWRLGSIIAVIIREYPVTITNTGGRPVWPCPKGTSTGGNHRSHWASSPARYCVRPDGSGGRYSGRSSRIRSLRIVIPYAQPIRSAITVAGIRGYACNSSRICGSTPSTFEPVLVR